MSAGLFNTAVEQAVSLGAKTILPFINGDPLSDFRMVNFVKWIARTYPEVEVGWYTNAYLLTEETAYNLLCSGNIKTFNISMQGGTKEVYEANMGLSWERVIENVEMFIKLNNQLKNPCTVAMNMCVFSKTKDTVDAFCERWSRLGCKICLGCFSNFGGMSHDEYGEAPWLTAPRKLCARATTHAYIYWNGDVGQCCFDLLGNTVYGNLQTQTLAEIFATEKYQQMLLAHNKLSVDEMPQICKNCNSPKFSG